MDRTSTIESVKELARTAVIAVIPVLLISLEQGQIEWRAVTLACAIAILRAVDKWLHKENLGLKNNGLTGF